MQVVVARVDLGHLERVVERVVQFEQRCERGVERNARVLYRL